MADRFTVSLLHEAPKIDRSKLPIDEHPREQVISQQLINLATTVHWFEASLSLFEFCRNSIPKPPLAGAWMHVAARDGGITLWHYQLAAKAILANLDRAPTIQSRVNMPEIRGAIGDLHFAFPPAQFKTLRDAIGHSNDLAASPRAIAKNRWKGRKVDGTVIDHSIIDNTFTATGFCGKRASYELHAVTLETLVKITRRIYGAF